MKVLFICLGNIERSKVAEVFYNSISGTKDASSAGTEVEKLGIEKKTIKQISEGRYGNISNPDVKLAINIMKEKGFDISNHQTIQLTPEIVERSDKIISFVNEKDLPNYLLSKKIIFWDVPDQKYCSYEMHLDAQNKIENQVKKLIKDEKRS